MAEQKKSHKLRHFVISVVVVLALIAAVCGGSWGAHAYFSDRVAPGVSLGSINLTGKTRAEVTSIVSGVLDSTKVDISVGSDTKTVSLSDLGAKEDVNATVNAVMSAKASTSLIGEIQRLNPWNKVNISISTSKIDDSKLVDWAVNTFIAQSDRVQPTTVSYDSSTQAFVVQEGKTGTTVKQDELVAAVNTALKNAGTTTKATVHTVAEASHISSVTAQATVTAANQRLETPVVLTNGNGKDITVDKATVASWMTYTSDNKKGTLALTVNDDAINQYINTHCSELDQNEVDQVDVRNHAGTVLRVNTQGVKGVKVKSDQTATVDAINKALSGSSSDKITVAADVTDFKTTSSAPDYSSANGDPWMEVNLDTQMAYAYKGSTLIRQFTISSGANADGHRSDDGTFYVHTKYTEQTMRGPGYVSPGVKWVTYYNGGEGFHTANWALDNIAKGRPGSHGCINMTESDAKWVYDFLQIGDLVKVHGTTPAEAVRS